MNALGDRMKGYEGIQSCKLIDKLPIIIRIDGRSFHTVTKHFDRPFDDVLTKTMTETAKELCENVQGCRLGYTQSDEISLLLFPKNRLNSETFFGNKIQKICSITASMATMYFYRHFLENFARKKIETGTTAYDAVIKDGVNFDARCFTLPECEATNYFIWRQQDATKNALQMIARTLYSHKELEGKKFSDMNEMLLAKGVSFDSYPTARKRGTAIIQIPTPIESACGAGVRNKWQVDYDTPVFSEAREYVEGCLSIDD